VLALSQLSRAVENREDKRPQLADLRESGSIEQDADIVMFVYRDEYYHMQKKPEEGSEKFGAWLEKGERIRGRAEVIVGKQRHGATGIVDVMFHKETTKFSDLADDAYIPERYE
jgi:replicative DNA helicase